MPNRSTDTLDSFISTHVIIIFDNNNYKNTSRETKNNCFVIRINV